MKHSLHSACLSSTAVPAAHPVSRDLRERAGGPMRPCTQTGELSRVREVGSTETRTQQGQGPGSGISRMGGYLLGDDPE